MRTLLHGLLALNFAVFMAAPTFAQAPAAAAPAAAARSPVGTGMEQAQLLPVVQNMVEKANATCTVSQARVIGGAEGADFYEAVCQGGVPIMINAAFPQTEDSAVSTTSCLGLKALAVTVSCTLVPEEAGTAFMAGLPAAANHPCTVTNSRFIAESTTTKQLFFEYACSEGPETSFVAGIDYSGAVKRTIPCVQAQSVGGCTLTDVTPILAASNARYSTMARAKGFNCDVKSVSAFPPSANNAYVNVAEIQCNDRPESAVVVEKAGNTSEVLNCIHARAESYSCSSSPAAASFPLLTADLAKVGRGECKVNGARPVGKSSQRSFVEVTCDGGAQGFMITYLLGVGAPEEATVCALATNLGGGCTMPANVKE